MADNPLSDTVASSAIKKAQLTWSLPPHSPLPGFSRGLTSRIRHARRRFLLTVYVDPFARNWLGFSTTDPDNCNAVFVQFYLAAKARKITDAGFPASRA